MIKIRLSWYICIILLVLGFVCYPQQTVGLYLNESGAFNGYTLFSPVGYTHIYLIDMQGRLVHEWTTDYRPGLSVYLLEDGTILRPGHLNDNPHFPTGGAGGRVQRLDWDGTVIWDFLYSNNEHMQHHDVELLPNGNVLMVAWESKTRAQARAAGRNPDLLRKDTLYHTTIAEVKPTGPATGDIVWKWSVWDHLIQDYDPSKDNYGVVGDHPELLDINYVENEMQPRADWNHANSVDYNADLDQIIISVRNMSEIWVIDHSTTTREAAGHAGGRYGKGGDFLYRWGNPEVYRAGDSTDQTLFVQHDAHWIEPGLPGAGNILVFNNGLKRLAPMAYSSVDEIAPPVESSGNYFLSPGPAYGPDTLEWIYTAPDKRFFYSHKISGAQRLPDNNTLICFGTKGRFFEVAPSGSIVWDYVNPVTKDGPLNQGDPVIGEYENLNTVFRCTRYAPDYPGLKGKDLTPQGPIEIYPSGIRNNEVYNDKLMINTFPNPFSTTINFRIAELQNRRILQAHIYNIEGQVVKEFTNSEILKFRNSAIEWDALNQPAGIYILSVEINGKVFQRPISLIR
jgi:hypothetical protein